MLNRKTTGFSDLILQMVGLLLPDTRSQIRILDEKKMFKIWGAQPAAHSGVRARYASLNQNNAHFRTLATNTANYKTTGCFIFT